MSGPRFSMVLPSEWQPLEFDPDRRDWSIDRLVRRALGTSERLEALRRDATRSYRELITGAAERGGFFGATLGTEVAGHPVAASVMAFLVEAPRGPDGDPVLSADQLALDLTEPLEDEDLVSTEVVELPVGRTVRLRAVMGAGVESSGGVEPRIDVVRYFTPRPPAALLVTAFSTPTLHVADVLGEIFDAMAASMAVSGGGEG